MKRISAVIPTYNVGKIIRDCLETLKWVDEIIIVDMGSKDKTLKICKEYKTRTIKNIPSEFNFDINRKIGMLKAKGDWILKIDSDERLLPALQEEIQSFLKEEQADDVHGYNLYCRLFIFNKETKYGFKTTSGQ